MPVVVTILPSLMPMSRTKAYPMFGSVAVFAGAASIGWNAERLLDVKTPVNTIVNACLRRALFGLAEVIPLSPLRASSKCWGRSSAWI